MTEYADLDYPLPNREWFQTKAGWASREWTHQARETAQRALVKTVGPRNVPEVNVDIWRFV